MWPCIGVFVARACVCMRVCLCVCAWWQGLYGDGASVCFSVSASQKKGRPRGVVLHFRSVINSPCAPTVFARLGRHGRRAGQSLAEEREEKSAT